MVQCAHRHSFSWGFVFQINKSAWYIDKYSKIQGLNSERAIVGDLALWQGILIIPAEMAFCRFLTQSNPPISTLLNQNHAVPPNFHIESLAVHPVAGESAMANSVRVAAAQMTSVNDLAANFATCSRLVKEAASAGAKLLCFPESFSYVGAKDGDSVKVAETLDGPIMQGYCSLARESNIWLSLGGFQEKGHDDAHICNTHVLIDDNGTVRSTYRKMHLFDVDVPSGRSYKESSFTDAGKDIVAVDSPFGRLGLTVCYDLRFPDIYQQLRFQNQAQVLLVPSAFTKVTGEAHWEILLRARAIETQCYVIAAAQAGKHNEKRESYGDTLIIDPWGKIVGQLPDRLSTGITVADIDFSLLDSVRAKMPICKHRKPADFWKATSL
ncbi:deaminated glutathione amidase, chloroplastic/cytosolic [Malania oleifera]|uniref:deaminated glutathione amidase, chloroplastic/cytosolic n=1 Tax=Malania oleifera TaxID=397392 RepID=UPI0025ADDB5E|nr:deaminated glutathione amidase, chloroplastic/cytosolic [Malania oleifera]